MELKKTTVALAAFMILALAIIGNYNILVVKTHETPNPVLEAGDKYKLESEVFKKETELKITELSLCIADMKAEADKAEATELKQRSEDLDDSIYINEKPQGEWEFIKHNFKHDIKILGQDYKNLLYRAFSISQ